MNKDFAEYAASASFTLTLSKPMILFLLAVDEAEKALDVSFSRFVSTGQSLARRGLFKWDVDYNGDHCNPHITEEGRQVAKLLRMAGHSTESIKAQAA